MEPGITSSLKEERVFPPSTEFTQKAYVKSLAEYKKLYDESIRDPEGFWEREAEEHLDWYKKWDSVLEYDFDSIGQTEAPYVKYFSGGTLNVSYNCIDRHVKNGKGDQTALIWQGEDPEQKRALTYQELLSEVCRLANVLKKHGVRKGTTVTLYLPMVLELPIALLACGRIGAIHSVVFSAFSADALKSRIQDCNSEMIITADLGFHAGKVNELKKKADEAAEDAPSVKRILVYNRGDTQAAMQEGRDFWWHEEIKAPDIEDRCEPAQQEAEDPLFILYTSGSTGKPKGVLHTTGGYSLYTHLTFKYIFDYHEGDIYWCTADIGWITGHSYLVYGPLSNGATSLMFEGVPTYPQPDRFWEIVAAYNVNIFYTAPTAIRALMRLGEEWPNKHDLSSLRVLGTVGEPINPEAWIWYHEVIGKKRCPIVDTWWQTETGGIMITTLPGAIPTKPGSAGMPFFGIAPEVVDKEGKPVGVNEGGSLTVTRPWPGMLRGTFGDAKNELIKKVYFSDYPGRYFTADGCRIDEDGYYWLLGRIDDVINVSAHRFATAEIESALVLYPDVAEAAVVGFPHETKGQGIYCYVTLKEGIQETDELRKALIMQVRGEISPIATPDIIHFTAALPKTRSGKIMRRILRKIAAGETDSLGDTSTLADPSVVDTLVAGARRM